MDPLREAARAVHCTADSVAENTTLGSGFQSLAFSSSVSRRRGFWDDRTRFPRQPPGVPPLGSQRGSLHPLHHEMVDSSKQMMNFSVAGSVAPAFREPISTLFTQQFRKV